MAFNLKLSEKQKLILSSTRLRNLVFILFTLFSAHSFASHDSTSSDLGEENHEKTSDHAKFNAGNFITHHIADAHEIHFFTMNEGKANETHYSIYLPVILKDENGFKVFSSSHFYHHQHEAQVNGKAQHYYMHDGYILFEEAIYKANGEKGIEFDAKGKISNASILDLSPTKSIFGILITGIILVLLFGSAAKKYKSNPNKAPSGMQNLLEPLVIFIRDEVAIPNIGKEKADRFLPFLLTTFFFIWAANLLGLLPFVGGFNIMGTLGVTILLAIVVFVITTINGKSAYWKHIFWPPGVPTPIKFILVPIEVISIFQKPLILMIRLTANIAAGHIIILAITCLVFIFGEQSASTGYGVGVGAVAFMVFMYFIELLVVFLQAYVFTLLAAMYFGSATEEAHH